MRGPSNGYIERRNLRRGKSRGIPMVFPKARETAKVTESRVQKNRSGHVGIRGSCVTGREQKAYNSVESGNDSRLLASSFSFCF